MTKNLTKLLILVMLISLPMAAQARQIMNIENEPVPMKLDGTSHTVEDVRDGIARGARQRGWNIIPGEGNELIASILVRERHYAEVTITYSKNTYSIRYRDSRQLKYNAARNTIHRNYNSWILNLSNSIKSHL